ncbi:non-oxidative hydroxyarylic acid decarboxylases subunit D [Dictyobacter kobayashii]|uniref:Phenolic acid decarboxylase subunit D n=1 Tax=Dictyobacter kobayashii TaxID=2014872 RepID=A0A402ASH2_9CHLR|nr:non-oxidative hydroxyarylic acid decarboxylases subunit D [Dictyobacter kobayashii]GCE21993.1 phenolic acid decarboxylase subunit D [Dictyobacter kobayashii]
MPTCPRCDDLNGSVLTESPVRGVWVMYRCPRCLFTWRSTEAEEITNPALYNKDFKLTPAMIEQAMITPAIGVPRKKKS